MLQQMLYIIDHMVDTSKLIDIQARVAVRLEELVGTEAAVRVLRKAADSLEQGDGPA